MKKILLFALLFSLASCVSRKSADRMQGEIDSLNLVVADKDKLIDEAFASIGEIAESLSEIRSREGLIRIDGEEISGSNFERMNHDLNDLSRLLEENRSRIAELEKKATALRKANQRIVGLENLIEELNTQLEVREGEISNLRRELKAAQDHSAQLSAEVASQQQEIASLTATQGELQQQVTTTENTLHTVYYLIAPQKQLLNDQVVVKRGTIGRTLTLSENPNLGLFTEADNRILKTLPIGQKEVVVVSAHPESSYWLVESESEKRTIESLVILDNELFWSLSKVLVISHK